MICRYRPIAPQVVGPPAEPLVYSIPFSNKASSKAGPVVTTIVDLGRGWEKNAYLN
jgi:hypothetical protein